MTLAFAVAVHAPDPLAFFLLLLPVGLMIGSIEIILNVEADRTEALVGRRIMNRAHSFWSLGFFAAGLAGGAIGQAGVSPQAHLALIVPVTAAAVALLLGGYQPSPRRPAEGKEAVPRLARPSGPILILVAVTLSAMLMEGASMDWSAIYMRDIFAAGPFLAGLAVACFAFTQAVTRFFADGFVDRHSPSTVARVLICVMTAGVLLVFFSPAAAGLAPRLRPHGGGIERRLPARDLGRGAAHRPAGGDQRRGAGADLLHHLPARAAAARLRRPALGHPLVLRRRPAARRRQPRARRLPRAERPYPSTKGAEPRVRAAAMNSRSIDGSGSPWIVASKARRRL